MRLTEFMVVIFAALLFLIPSLKKEQSGPFERQAQEEAPTEEVLEVPNSYKVTYNVTHPSQEAIADILWMKKAAQVAMDAGVPYFNVLKQTITPKYNQRHRVKLSQVEGVIELDNDPMRAEFDAQEIESLVLTDYPAPE